MYQTHNKSSWWSVNISFSEADIYVSKSISHLSGQ